MKMFFVDLISSAAGHASITIAVGPDESTDEVETTLADFGISPSDVRIVELPVDTIWVRDFGPLVVEDSHGARSALDLKYFGSDRDEVFATIASHELWGIPARTDDLILDGGNILSDGAGRCVTTGFVLDDEFRPKDEPDFGERLKELFGCREVIVLPRLFGEETGHVDMYVALPGHGRAIVGSYPAWQDPENALLLDEAAEQLRVAGFEVSRIPMGYNADSIYRTYTNLLALNGIVLVPIYPDHPFGEREALLAIGAAYPGREIVPVIATEPIALGGAIHCATNALPAGK